MENFGREITYPTVEQICEVNRRMVKEFGGFFFPPHNLHNLGALEYILAAIKFSVYQIDIYPSLKEKSAAIAHHIISRHVFHDGNKRTATSIAWEFLRSNGVQLFLEPSIVELTVGIAAGEATQSELLEWLHGHQQR